MFIDITIPIENDPVGVVYFIGFKFNPSLKMVAIELFFIAVKIYYQFNRNGIYPVYKIQIQKRALAQNTTELFLNYLGEAYSTPTETVIFGYIFFYTHLIPMSSI